MYHSRVEEERAGAVTTCSLQRCSVKKRVLRNFAKLTGKHLCQRLFFNKVAGLRLFTMINKLGLNISRNSAIFQEDLPDVFTELRKLPRSLRPAKKQSLAQVFSCEFCGISKNTFFTEHLLATAFELHGGVP